MLNIENLDVQTAHNRLLRQFAHNQIGLESCIDQCVKKVDIIAHITIDQTVKKWFSTSREQFSQMVYKQGFQNRIAQSLITEFNKKITKSLKNRCTNHLVFFIIKVASETLNKGLSKEKLDAWKELCKNHFLYFSNFTNIKSDPRSHLLIRTYEIYNFLLDQNSLQIQDSPSLFQEDERTTQKNNFEKEYQWVQQRILELKF